MILNKKNTALLMTALDCQAGLFYWLQHETNLIGNNEYGTIKGNFEAWKVEYESGNLYITKPDDSTELLSGIDQFPIPPSR